MFDFIWSQYKLGKLTAAQVRAYAPKIITWEQVDQILGSDE